MKGYATEVRITGMQDAIPGEGAEDIAVVNCTSRSKEDWCLDLSPFFLGPVNLYDGLIAMNFENAWQFAKVYDDMVDKNESPTQVYWKWAKEGWSLEKAKRFPMGPGAIPLYSWWNGEKLDYISARKKIYAPLYAELVTKTKGYARLKTMITCGKYKQVWLRDFDGYDHDELGMSLEEVLNEPRKKMGHGFVLKMLLTNDLCWKRDTVVKAVMQNKKQGLVSCGVLIRSKGMYLMCHATKNTPLSHTDKSWTIPKGMPEEGESFVQAAEREVKEETGLRLKLKSDKELCSYTVGKKEKKKTVHVFFHEDDTLANEELKCMSMIDESCMDKNLIGKPEVDGYKWMPWDMCRERAMNSQSAGIFKKKEPE